MPNTMSRLAPLLAAALASCGHAPTKAQDLPTIKAHSPSVDVEDGHNLRKGHWNIDPSLPLDTYYAERSRATKTVTFRTDQDAIAFDVEPGKDYDFVIVLDGKPCRTRISGLHRSCTRNGSEDLTRPAEIPFALNSHNRMRLEARVNGSAPLVLMFDTGADTTVLYPSALAKGVKPRFDGIIQNSGLGGISTRSTSSDNRLEIAGLTWPHEQVMLIEKPDRDLDGILGMNVFEDRILEIDYGRGVMRVRDSLPALGGYAWGAMQIRGTSPYIEATLGLGTKQHNDWFLLDTGYTASVHLTRDFWDRNGLGGTMERLGDSLSHGVGDVAVAGEFYRLPELMLGGAAMKGVPANVEVKPTGNTQATGLLGMDVLKRLDTVIDFTTNTIYLRPNASIGEPFAKPVHWRLPVLMGSGVAILLAGVGVWMATRRRGRK